MQRLGNAAYKWRNSNKYDSDTESESKWRTKKCKPVNVEKDGNCLYRAVSCAITGHQDEHLALRLYALVVLVDYRPFFEKLLAIFDERAYERFVAENAKRGMIDERFVLIVTIVDVYY